MEPCGHSSRSPCLWAVSVGECIILLWPCRCGFLWIPRRCSHEPPMLVSLACRSLFISVRWAFLACVAFLQSVCNIQCLHPQLRPRSLLSKACNPYSASSQVFGVPMYSPQPWQDHRLAMIRVVLLYVILSNHCCLCLSFLHFILFLDFTRQNHCQGHK